MGSGGSRRPNPTPHALRRDKEEPGRPRDRSRAGLSEPGGPGAAALPSLFPPVGSVPGRVGRRRAPGWGHLFSGKGLGRPAGRPATEGRRARAPDGGPEAAGVTSSPPERRAARGPCAEWAAVAPARDGGARRTVAGLARRGGGSPARGGLAEAAGAQDSAPLFCAMPGSGLGTRTACVQARCCLAVTLG